MDGNATSIIIALIALLGSTIGAVVWFGKYFLRELVKVLQEHTKASNRQVESNKKLTRAVELNSETSDEMITFMRSLNGKLRKATSQTIKEQNVAHQTVVEKTTK